MGSQKNEIYTNSNIVSSSIPNTVVPNTSIRHDGITENSLTNVIEALDRTQIGIGEVSTIERGVVHESIPENSMAEISAIKTALVHFGSAQIGVDKGSIYEVGLTTSGPTQISSIKDGVIQLSSFHISSPEISPTEIGIVQVSSFQKGSFQVDPTQVSPTQVSPYHEQTSSAAINTPSKVSFSRFIPIQHFFNIHNSNPATTNTYKDNLQNLWNTLFDPTNPFNLNLQITDLPVGQLAEAQITNYDSFGRPNGGTILIDDDANGIGWFIDPTPNNNSEYTTTLTDTAFRATTGDAYGKYDLLTTILHETGHLLGIINGYSEFDRHIQTINGTKTFITNNITATLTPDGSHLDSKAHPYDLINNSLAPGVRKLPSWLNLQMLNAIRTTTVAPSSTTQLTAPLTAILLADITNGNFNETDPTKPEFGWTTRGATTILNSHAVLTEDSPLLSNLTQTFIIPDNAKYLQFTILDTQLGTNTFAPNDAFEVALLDTQTLTPLIGTATGLTHTDSLLNLQQTGNTYFSNNVKIAGANTSGDKIALNTPRTVNIDISNIAPGTAATLYFDLLGFGAKDAQVIIDNVILLNDDLITPIANNDTATTDQGQPILINVLTNDSTPNGTVQLGTAANGNIIINSDNSLTYTPNNNFVGTDTFTYIILDNNAISNEATVTVTVTVNNIAPTINNVSVESNIQEGITSTFSATATDPGNDLTYSWNFGDGTDAVIGENVNHIFADNGIYTVTLTVSDTNGANTSQTITTNVSNIAPVVQAGVDITTDEGTAITFNGNFNDPGILDTHTITWDFGDNSTATGILNPIHTYTLHSRSLLKTLQNLVKPKGIVKCDLGKYKLHLLSLLKG
nr:PKD domain-containing protein [Anabaena sp. CCAP 1446/1C]